jgi:hypothetical protein
MCRCSKGFSLSSPGVLGSGPSYVVSIHHCLIRPHPPVPLARCDFALTLIRSAFAGRERLGDPRDLPYFHCCAFPTCRRPYPGGPPCPSVGLTRRFQASSSYQGVATHQPVSASYTQRVISFRGCIVLVMLRPARLPCPPDWLQRNEAMCAPPRLLRTDLLTCGLCHSRFWRCSLPGNAGSQARWANGKSPIAGTFTRQVTAASEAAR